MGLLCLLLLAFTSCGSDDNDEPAPKPEEKKAASATAEYVVNLSQNLLDAVTITDTAISWGGNADGNDPTATPRSPPTVPLAQPAECNDTPFPLEGDNFQAFFRDDLFFLRRKK